MQYRGAQDVERDGDGGVDDHRKRGVHVHDADPAAGPPIPRIGAVVGAGGPRVALVETPIGIRDDLGRADAGDRENPHRQRDVGAGETRHEAAHQVTRVDAVACPLQEARQAVPQARAAACAGRS